MNDIVKIIPLGGLDESGKNMTLVEINDEIIVVDAGVAYPNRNMPGVDYIIPQFDYLKENASRIKGYLISHGHDDQMGALAYIYDSCPAPIYCSKVTAAKIRQFGAHVGYDHSKFDFKIVPPTCSFKLSGRKIQFFHTAHNIADSSGIAISTTLGNVVFTGDFVVENNAVASYDHDFLAMAKIAEEPTLALLSESVYADKDGYTAPRYKLTTHIEEFIKNAKGRLFVAVFASNLYQVEEVIRQAIINHRKIVFYDQETQEIVRTMQEVGQLLIPVNNFAPLDDVNRLAQSDTMILMLGYGTEIYDKIALLADHQNEDHRIQITQDDYFIAACPSNSNTELEHTDAIDSLYRTDCHVLNITRKMLLNMHASKEDLKMMVSAFKPKYYVPITGLYKDMLNNAQTALSMGINLNHRNVFLMENGSTLRIDGNSAKIIDEGIRHGDLLIDGKGVGDISSNVLDDRQKLADGVIILAATISRKSRRIVAGPDVQIRGFVILKDADNVLSEVTRVFVSTIEEFLKESYLNIDEMKQNVYMKCLRSIRWLTGREPMILPLIISID